MPGPVFSRLSTLAGAVDAVRQRGAVSVWPPARPTAAADGDRHAGGGRPLSFGRMPSPWRWPGCPAKLSAGLPARQGSARPGSAVGGSVGWTRVPGRARAGGTRCCVAAGQRGRIAACSAASWFVVAVEIVIVVALGCCSMRFSAMEAWLDAGSDGRRTGARVCLPQGPAPPAPACSAAGCWSMVVEVDCGVPVSPNRNRRRTSCHRWCRTASRKAPRRAGVGAGRSGPRCVPLMWPWSDVAGDGASWPAVDGVAEVAGADQSLMVTCRLPGRSASSALFPGQAVYGEAGRCSRPVRADCRRRRSGPAVGPSVHGSDVAAGDAAVGAAGDRCEAGGVTPPCSIVRSAEGQRAGGAAVGQVRAASRRRKLPAEMAAVPPPAALNASVTSRLLPLVLMMPPAKVAVAACTPRADAYVAAGDDEAGHGGGVVEGGRAAADAGGARPRRRRRAVALPPVTLKVGDRRRCQLSWRRAAGDVEAGDRPAAAEERPCRRPRWRCRR